MDGREQDYRRANESLHLEEAVRERIREACRDVKKAQEAGTGRTAAQERRREENHMKRKKGWLYGGAAAAGLLLGVAVFLFGRPGGLTGGGVSAHVLAAAEYPAALAFDDREGYRDLVDRIGDVPEEFSQALSRFAVDSAYLALGQETEKNLCYSPLSLYMALAIAAETAGGETREEILSCLHYDGDSLADEMHRYLTLRFKDNEITVVKAANSLWLNERAASGEWWQYREDTLQRLAESYQTDSYAGDFGSPKLQEDMSSWVVKQTKGLLGGDAEDFALEEDGALSILSTLYYYDQWYSRFNKDNNIEDIFTCQDGTQVTAEYMRTTKNPYPVLAVEGYTAASLSMKGGSRITFVLPDEGVSPADILADETAMARLLGLTEEPETVRAEVRFYIPKYQFQSSLDLTETAKGLGLASAFSPETADFSGITGDAKLPVWLNGIRQQTSMSIDEKGCEAAAFTQIDYAGAAPPIDNIVEFKLNRPFLIIVSVGEPYFIGVINRP